MVYGKEHWWKVLGQVGQVAHSTRLQGTSFELHGDQHNAVGLARLKHAGDRQDQMMTAPKMWGTNIKLGIQGSLV